MMIVGTLPFQDHNESSTVFKILDVAYVVPDFVTQGFRDLISQILVRSARAGSQALADVVQGPREATYRAANCCTSLGCQSGWLGRGECWWFLLTVVDDCAVAPSNRHLKNVVARHNTG